MKTRCIWFNKHLSNTGELVALTRDARRAGEFRLVCSHPRASFAAKLDGDLFEKEPIGLDDDAYVRFCLDFVKRHEVDLFFPGRKVLPIVRARAEFEAGGTRVVAAGDAWAMALLQSKGRTYASLQDDGVCIPDHEVVHDLAGFDAAFARLRSTHSVLCYKPDFSVYGIGFHVIAESASVKTAHGRPWRITLEDARRRLGSEGPFRDLMVMQYLPGPEHSVDCLARDGELIRCTVRRKLDGGQMLEENTLLVAAVRRLTARFRLTNLFNVQFRDTGGKSYLLEINPRMSGGLPFACASGVNFLLWAIRLALGTATPDDVPQPRVGIWVPQPQPVSSL